LTGEPGEFDTTSVFEGVNYTTHTTLRAKAANAKLHGAIAVMYVEGPIYGTTPENLRPPRNDEPYIDCGMPALRITREAVAALFPEFDLDALQRFIDGNTQPRSLSLKTDTLEIAVDLTRQTVNVKNVGAIIPGDSNVIVIGAHYDHLGYGQSGSLDEKPGQIHNGADDNASGVASIIEIARELKDYPITSTVLVAAFTAEEVGLGGSKQLTDHFPLTLDHVRAMFNLDMVGRVTDNKLTVVGCKTAEEFPALVDSANQYVGLNVTCKGDGYGPSDHMNFFLVNIPVLYLFSGAHSDYHRSTDDADKINYADMARVVDFTSKAIRYIDRRAEPLTFVKAAEPTQQGGGRFRSSFGSIPDFSQPDSVKGMLLSGVREGGPAALAGLQRGDLLTKLGKVVINNIYDLTYALQIYAPGDTVEVVFKRDEADQVAQAVLQQSTR
ncbi:MAG: M20/M25/M40 family metallo-hydrolase, partial [Calditrichota bacterium]